MRGRVGTLFGITVACALMMSGTALATTGPPVATTGAATSIDDNSAALHGKINPNGNTTTYYFEWGTTPQYGTAGEVKTLTQTGTTAVPVSESATRLAPATTYHYALVAVSGSTTVVGQDQTFTTTPAPVVSTGPATGVSASRATLTGTVNPNGYSTTWYFQWGAGRLTSQTIPQTIGPSTTPQQVSSTLPVLGPETLYHYRLVAVHSNSAPVAGATQTFLTYPSSPSFSRVFAHTTPVRARRRPYTFTTTGALGHPFWVPSQYACVGDVTIQFFHKHRRVRYTNVPLQPNCKFSAVTVFHHLPGYGRWRRPVQLRVITKFASSAYLAASRDRTEHITVG